MHHVSIGKKIKHNFAAKCNDSELVVYHTKKKIARATAWKMSKYGVFSCPYFPVFGLIRRFTDTFHAVER